MKLLLLLLVLFQLSCEVKFTKLLSQVDYSVEKFKEIYSRGGTSKAFSIAMQIYVETVTYYEEHGFELPNIEKTQNCSSALHFLHEMLELSEWNKEFQTIFKNLHQLHKSCTNMDFEYGQSLEGFDDKCALCTVLTQIIENYIVYYKRDSADFINKEFCNLFEGMVKPTCEAFIHYIGPLLIEKLAKKENADVICHSVGWCTNPQCKIKPDTEWNIASVLKSKSNKPAPWEWLVHLFTDRFGDKHLPPFDLDNDTFSDISTFRGYHWRGTDCNEFDSKIYPGRKTSSKYSVGDQDCNGIYGVDSNGKLYEEKFCKDSKRFGVAVIGDSAGAHFSIPEKFFNVTMMHKGTFKDLLPRIADELDIPHESAYTGHSKTSYLSHSVYKYARKWNLCNNNDYQNVGVNGGDSGNTWGNIKALRRDPKNDYPLIMFMELIGNDVCAKDFDGMTKPEEFKKNILKLLKWLDENVPAESHLIIVGLADGDLLFDYLHDSIHPLNVTYSTVYDFLNCLKISPCWGWLNTNETIRKLTTQRAKILSKIYQEIIDDGTVFNNFDIVYYEFPTQDILNRKKEEGGDPRDMIEKCDGFHPSVEFHSDLADWFWLKIQTEHPEWIGEANKFNEEIKKIFELSDID